ncbi:3-oxoacyl-[acyl-carrier-protein] reductase [Anaerosinus gibii]|uniref:3-oxoacyl-[acyl-carrier-protein] reductase n=1 Tax=Selenobaculum gibii TaxID=3054208 RepID=A0A9Y2AH39_9FIRM|nr:3-oxoacyl-[acyl-carrier-protein] reductase [Selenobaculum gbiensis]WIW69598.1 3-oxoacyl-[acyl-carrier-protein] reductase [Selenobaculum gbiensis]
MHLDGKVALVTGASRGIGRAIAILLAKAGALVVINYAGNQEAAQSVESEINSFGGKSFLIQADVSKADAVEEMIQEVVKECGRIDILINNAGITRDSLLMRMKESDWDDVLNTNLKGIFLCTKAVSRLMMKQKSGRIVNMTSVVGIMGNSGQANYAAAKAGVIGFTKSMARELASRGITVNAVAPGFIATDMTAILSEEVKRELSNRVPLQRFGEADDVAKAVMFLVSDNASYITGQTLNVDGGMVM